MTVSQLTLYNAPIPLPDRPQLRQERPFCRNQNQTGSKPRSGRPIFDQRRERRPHEPDETAWQAIRRGWYLGGKEFREELLAELGERAGENHAGPDLEESDEQKALAIVEPELRRRRWTLQQLTRWRKADKRKVRIALRLRRETTMTLKWMAEQLAMGAWASVARRLCEAKP
jgi:hypothetical protein